MATIVRGANGRVIFRRDDALPAIAARTRDPHQQPVSYPSAIESADVFTSEDGLAYRLVDVFQPLDGWVSAETLMEWYALREFTQVVDLVRRACVEPAMLRGSGTRRYRVLDPARCASRAAELRSPAINPAAQRRRRPRR